MTALWQDLRHGVRIIARSPTFSITAVLTLALGIGASTIVFSVVYNVFFQALPYKDYSRSVLLGVQSPGNVGEANIRRYFSSAEVQAFREQNHVFDEIITFARMRPTYEDGKSVGFFPFGTRVSTNTFEFLGVPPLLGRTIVEADGTPGAPSVFVMNYRFWQRGFGGDPKILGRVFILNGIPTTLVGIMPSRFNAFGANFWLPASPDGAEVSILGRLRPRVSVRTAGADVDAIAHRMHKANPGGIFPEDPFAITSQTLLDSLIGSFKTTLYVLLAAVLLLLLIGCSNVANLLLVRAIAREREIAVRAALGATRSRLVRQLLAESFVLASAASLAGCGLAYFGLKAVVALIPVGALPEETMIRMNAPILFLALGMSIVTTVLCSLAPALHAVRRDVQQSLAGIGKGVGGGYRHERLRAGLAAGEIALSVVLLIGACLLMRSFLVLTHVDLGFDPRNILYFELNLSPAYNTDLPGSLQRKNALTHQLLVRMQALPGVISVAESADTPPLRYEFSDTIIPGKPHTDHWETRYEMCSDGYFQTLGLPLLRGRLFSEDDVSAARNVMVVNEAFSHKYFPGENPLGQKVRLDVFDFPNFRNVAPHDTYFEIVGIVRDYKTRSYDEPSWQTFPHAFVPYSVAGFNWRTFMARTSVDPGSLLENMGQEVRTLDPGVRISASGTLEGSLREFYRAPRFELATLGAFAALGFTLAAIGIFGVMAYGVSLRTHEIGVRVALGAQSAHVVRLVLLSGGRIIGGGIVIGVVTSLGLTRLFRSQFPGISATDPFTFAIVVTVVVLVGIAACLVPARRATQIEPLAALRYE